MNKSKYISLVIVGSIIIGTILYFGFKKTKMLPTLLPQQSQLIVDDSEPKPPEPWGQITRDYVIKHIEWTYAHGKSYEQFSLKEGEPKDLVIEFYPPNLRYDIEVPEKLPPEKFNGGMLVFRIIDKKPKLIWESTEDIYQTEPILAVRDMTGDGVKEIVVMWQKDAKSEQLFIYKLNKNDAFDLMTPSSRSKIFFPAFNGEDNTIQIIDLDKDGIPEVTLPSTKPPYDYHEAYKWNGKEYYLWKTSPTPFAPYSPF